MRSAMRTTSLTAAAAVAGASLTFLAAPAADAAVPAGADIVGTAQVNGAATANVDVELYAAVAGSTNYTFVDDIESDAAGAYGFDLDSYSATYVSYKLRFLDDRTVTGDGLYAKGFYYGNVPTLKRSTPINRPAAGTVFTVPTTSLSLYAGIKGTISVPVPAGYLYSGDVSAYDEDDNFAGSGGFDSNPANDATNPLNGLTTYLIRDLEPGHTYKLYVSASAQPATGTGDTINYVGHFIGGGQNYDSATEYTVGASGTIYQPVNDALGTTLTAATAPSVVGQVAPGKTLSVANGTWNRNADNEYTYQWLLNEVQVSTASTYTVGKGDLGKKLRVLVTAKNADFVGQASTETTKVGYATKLKAKAKKAVVKGRTVVQVTGKLKVQGAKKKAAKLAKGKVLVTELNAEGDAVKVGKGKVVKGVLQVTLKGVTAGKHEFLVSFEGKKVAAVEKTVKVKV